RGLDSTPSADQLGPTPSSLDLAPRGLRESVRPHHQRAVELATSEHLDRPALPDQPVGEQRLRVDLPALEHPGQRLDVHHRVLDPVAVGKALQLGDAALQRHLAALEPELGVVAGAVALGASPSGLAARAGSAATDPLAVLPRPLGRAEVMELHVCSPFSRPRCFAPPSGTSSTFTRWWTLAIMPRISGLSSLTTESLTRCSPRRRTVSFWSFGRSITLRTCVTLSLVTVDLLELGRPRRLQALLRRGHGLKHGPGRHLVHPATAKPRNVLGPAELPQAGDRRLHDVDLVARAERLGQDVLDSGALDERPYRPAGDHPGAGGGRFEQDDPGAVLAHHLVRDRGAHHGDLEHLPLGLLDALGDRRRHLLGLAVADADTPGAVAHDHERGEREATAALDDLGHPVDRDDPLLVDALLLLGRVVASHQIDRPPSLAPSASAATRPWYSRPPRSNTARSIPRSLARPASRAPTALAASFLSPWTWTSRSQAAASVRAEASSISWA